MTETADIWGQENFGSIVEFPCIVPQLLLTLGVLLSILQRDFRLSFQLETRVKVRALKLLLDYLYQAN